MTERIICSFSVSASSVIFLGFFKCSTTVGLANVAHIAQTGQQDARHVTILARLMPAYLADLQTAAVEGRMEERKLIELLERLLAVVTTKPAYKVFEQLRLDALQLFHELGNEKLAKLTAFLEKRLPRAIHKKASELCSTASRGSLEHQASTP